MFFQGYILFILYLVISENIFIYPHFFFTQVPIEILSAPLIFIYCKTLLKIKSNKKYESIYFIPSVIIIIIFFPYYIMDTSTKVKVITDFMYENKFIDLRIILGFVSLYLSFFMALSLFTLAKSKDTTVIIFAPLKLLLISGLLIGFYSIIYIIIWTRTMLTISVIVISILILFFYILLQKYPFLQFISTNRTGKRYKNRMKETSYRLPFMSDSIPIPPFLQRSSRCLVFLQNNLKNLSS